MKKKILFLGDSITAGYGVGIEKAYPALLQHEFNHRQIGLEIINCGVSGHTTQDGAGRHVELLRKHRPEYFVLALGANDMLRGHAPSQVRDNLDRILRDARRSGAQPFILGMRAVPFIYGWDYAAQFDEAFRLVATDHSAPLHRCFIEEVIGAVELNQSDGIHPNVQGQRKISQTVLDFLLPHLVEVPILLGMPHARTEMETEV